MSKIWAVGDIHGSLGKLKTLLSRLKWDPEHDTLLFIGDFIDRGPESAQVIEHVLKLKKWSENIVCLRGNHEQLLLDFLHGKNVETFLYNGGQATIESYGGPNGGMPEEHYEFISTLPYYFESDDYIFVHAGLRDGIPLPLQDPQDMLWIRDEFISSEYDHGRRVVYGHTPTRKPVVTPNKIGIDTGAVYGGNLTCLEIPDLIFHTA